MDNVTDYTGLRLVIDPQENEFYLFADSDSGPGIVHGKLGESQFFYNVKRGKGDDGAFTGALLVDRFPFELVKYSDVRIKHLLNETNDVSKSQTNTKEISVEKTKEFEFFNPETYEDGSVIQPPKTLSRKNRKAWYRECKEYRELKGKGIVNEEATTIPLDSNKNDTNDDSIASPSDPIAPQVDVPVAPDLSHSSNRPPKEKEEPIAGANNVYCLIKDHPEGYVISYYHTPTHEHMVLGSLPLPHPHDKSYRRFLMCRKQKTAEQLLEKLKAHKDYSRYVSDGAMECKVTPVTTLPIESWNEEALLIVDIYSFFNSKLMTS